MTDDAAKPAVVTISGVEVVTIPLAHYAELLNCQRQLAAPDRPSIQLPADSRSRIERDPEVATFLMQHLGRMRQSEIITACRERFGTDRTPSQASMSRFWHRRKGR